MSGHNEIIQYVYLFLGPQILCENCYNMMLNIIMIQRRN